MSTMMQNNPPSEKSVNSNNNEMIHYRMGSTADIDSSAYPSKSYRKKPINNYQNQNGGSVSPRRRFNNNNNNNSQNNDNQNKRNHPNINYNHSRRNSQNDGNNNVNIIKHPPKPRENSQKPVKPRKTDQESHEPSSASSQRSVSPAPSTTSNSVSNQTPSSIASDEPKKTREYSQEFMHLVRQKMEDVNLSPQKNGKNHILVQQNGSSNRKNEVDFSALGIALSGIASDNYSNYHLGQLLYHPVQQNSPQKQQQIYQHWTFPRGGGGYPVTHYQHNYHRNGYRNYTNYHQEEQQNVCKCLYPARNSNNTIFCIHCRYPVKKHPNSYSQNHKRYNNRNSMNGSYHNNSYHNQNRSNNNPNRSHNNSFKNSHDNYEANNESYSGKNYQKKFTRNTYLKPQDPPKSLSPTPTPSTSSKSESPTIDNPQNDSGSAKSITFGNFDLPLEDYPSSNSSSSGSSTTQSQQVTPQNTQSQSQNQNQEYESYNRQYQHQLPQQQQLEFYLPDAQLQQPSPTSYGFWFNYAPTSYQNLQPYQPQQFSSNEGDTHKRRATGRHSPNMYPATISLQVPATITGFNTNNINSRKSPPINGFRVPFVYPQDNSNFCPSDRFLARAHLVEIRETPKTLLNHSKWDPLTQDIWSRFLQYQQTEETYRKKMLLWRQLYNIVKQRFLEKTHPKNGLYLVGSTISGFGADSSDVDMCLVATKTNSIDPRTEALVHLSCLESHIKESDGFEQFCLIQARVPILRFKDSKHLLEVDLNWNNCVGIRNTHLLYCYSQMDWRLRPLALIVKLWAQHHNINDAKNSTISSYSLVLMVIHFLQFAVSPPVLPCLHNVYPEKFQIYHDISNIDMVEELEPILSDNKQSLGELFVEFLKYYSHFEYSKYAISIRVGSTLPIEDCRIVRNLKNDPNHWKTLCIEEPFDLTNTARSVYDEETFENIKHVFYLSWCKLRENLDLSVVFAQPMFHQSNGVYQMPPTPSVSPTIHQNGDGYANFDTKLS